MEKEKPLYSLTVDEFKALSFSIADEIRLKHQAIIEEDVEDPRDTIFLTELVALTGYTPSTIYSKVSRGEIPVLSSGRPLTFSKSDILNWMKAGKPSPTEQLAHSKFKKLK